MANDRRLDAAEKRVARALAQVSTTSERDYGEYLGRPVAFARERCRFEPYGRQVEVIESAMANPWTVVRGAHSMGKDAVLAPIALYGAFVAKMLVVVISATERQLLGQTFREIRARHDAGQLPGRVLTSAIEIHGEKRIIAMTSGSTSNLTGWHDPNGVLILISEAQGEQVEAAAFDAAIANATDAKSRIVVVGNPVKPAGRFYEVHNRPGWSQIAISAFDHPNIVERREVIPGGPSRAWIDAVRQEYGETSPYYVSRVLGEFPSEGSVDGLIRREWLAAAFDRHDSNALAVEAARHPIILALDVARYGPDATVLAVVQGPVVRELITWRGVSITETCATVMRHAQRFRADATKPLPLIVVDEPGLGGGVIDVLRDQKCRVVAFNGGAAAKDERYYLLRSESHWRFREALEKDQIALPRDSALEEEALAIEWQLTAHGKIQVLSKDTVRASISRSPDRLDAVVMGLAQSLVAPHRVPIVKPFTIPLAPFYRDEPRIEYYD